MADSCRVLQLENNVLLDLRVRAVKSAGVTIKPGLTEREKAIVHPNQTTFRLSSDYKILMVDLEYLRCQIAMKACNCE